MFVIGIADCYVLKSFSPGAEGYLRQQFRQLYGIGIGYFSGNLEYAAQYADMLLQPMPNGLQRLTPLPLVLPAARGGFRAIRG